jgi:putative ABC transport system permease protein
VNDLVLTLRDPANHEAARVQLEAALAAGFPDLGATVMTREEDPAYRLNDSDIDGDQQVYDIFAFLMFAGAVVAAFNLIARIVESQRREIGLSMVLGVRPLWIALRPMLVAGQIAFLGVLFGVAVGLLIGQAMASLLRDLQPLPRWQTAFLPGVFVAVGTAGFLIPFAATFMQMPIRNVVRAPRRSLLTIVGIGAALAALVAFAGLIDSFLNAINLGNAETLSRNPDRIEVALDRFYPAAGPQVQSITANPSVASAEAHIRVGGTVSKNDEEIPVQVELLPLDSEMWEPTISRGSRDRTSAGIYLSELAGENLGVGPGDTITLEHPVVTPDGAVTLARTELPVLGLHPHPYRFIAYMDLEHADKFGMTGLTNLVLVTPAPGQTRDLVKRELFGLPGVASVQGVSEVAEVLDRLLRSFVTILRVIEGAMLLLALLIAFNSASISVDERAREHATMFAFGVPIRKVVRMAVVENLILGVLATAAGITSGWFLLRLIIAIRIPETLPDVYIPPSVSTTTLITTLVLGILAVGAAPLLTIRRLRRMNIPATLKVFD